MSVHDAEAESSFLSPHVEGRIVIVSDSVSIMELSHDNEIFSIKENLLLIDLCLGHSFFFFAEDLLHSIFLFYWMIMKMGMKVDDAEEFPCGDGLRDRAVIHTS